MPGRRRRLVRRFPIGIERRVRGGLEGATEAPAPASCLTPDGVHPPNSHVVHDAAQWSRSRRSRTAPRRRTWFGEDDREPIPAGGPHHGAAAHARPARRFARYVRVGMLVVAIEALAVDLQAAVTAGRVERAAAVAPRRSPDVGLIRTTGSRNRRRPHPGNSRGAICHDTDGW